MNTSPRQLVVVSTTPTGQPRTYRLVEDQERVSVAAAYRRLALAILGMDVATLAAELSRLRQAA
jgi:hypothetical protein